MKQYIALLLAMLLVMGLVGCGNSEEKTTVPAPVPTTQPTEPVPTDPTEPPVPEGNQVGNRAISFDLQVVDENGATGETVNPAEMYKVTVLNFWGTWCKPCTGELPHFNQIIREYEVAVIAVHSRDAKESMPQFIGNNYPDSPMIFAWDQTGSDEYQDDYYLAMGGNGNFPYTVIINEQGIITHLFWGAIDHETLAKAVEEAGAPKKELKVIDEAVTAVEDYFDLMFNGNAEKLSGLVPQKVWEDLSVTPEALYDALPQYLQEVLQDERNAYGNKLSYVLKITDCLLIPDANMETYKGNLQNLYGVDPSGVIGGCNITFNLSLGGNKGAKTFYDVQMPLVCIEDGWYLIDCTEDSMEALRGAALIEELILRQAG